MKNSIKMAALLIGSAVAACAATPGGAGMRDSLTATDNLGPVIGQARQRREPIHQNPPTPRLPFQVSGYFTTKATSLRRLHGRVQGGS